ncbi:MAG: creatininase family protein [Chloroflexi bacterium]|nr:creatininase family protein [Chloroflexota bacterium]
MNELSLLDIPWPDAQRLCQDAGGVVLIPMGATEGHGYHCPLGTDAFIAEAVAHRAAALARVPFTPTVTIGVSPQHLEGRPGTLTVRESVFVEYMRDICRSLIHNGWTKLVVVSQHEGNIPPIWTLMRRIKYETGALFVGADLPTLTRSMINDIVENPPQELPQWHASEIETSEILAIDKAMVRWERAAAVKPSTPSYVAASKKFQQDAGFSKAIKFAGHGVFMPQENSDYSESGTVGNPMRATAEKGTRILNRFSEFVADLCNELKPLKVHVHNATFADRM